MLQNHLCLFNKRFLKKKMKSTIKPIIEQNEIDDIINKVKKSSINKFHKTTGERSGDIVSI